MSAFFVGEPASQGMPADRIQIGVRAGARVLECTITADAVGTAAGRMPRNSAEVIEVFRRHEGRFCRIVTSMLAAGHDAPSITVTASDVTQQAT